MNRTWLLFAFSIVALKAVSQEDAAPAKVKRFGHYTEIGALAATKKQTRQRNYCSVYFSNGKWLQPGQQFIYWSRRRS